MRRSLFGSASVLCAGLLGQSLAFADAPVNFRVSAQPTYLAIKSDGTRFSPTVLQVKAEVAMNDGWMDGVGAQVMVGMPVSDYSKNNTHMDVGEQAAAYLTLSNPDYELADLRVSILLGYASTELEVSTPALPEGQQTFVDTFSGFSYGISLQDPIFEGKPWYWSIDVVRYYKDDHLRLDGFSLGVGYVF